MRLQKQISDDFGARANWGAAVLHPYKVLSAPDELVARIAG
jgi:hypothetical protein